MEVGEGEQDQEHRMQEYWAYGGACLFCVAKYILGIKGHKVSHVPNLKIFLYKEAHGHLEIRHQTVSIPFLSPSQDLGN